jgi:hypothetical protein
VIVCLFSIRLRLGVVDCIEILFIFISFIKRPDKIVEEHMGAALYQTYLK